jgi:hypothetical protein
VVTGNNVHDNGGLAIVNAPKGEPFTASENWWGTADGLKILSVTAGKVIVESALDGPAPEGKPFALSVLKGPLAGTVREDSHLIAAYSPYVVTKGVMIEGGSTLYVQPGVTIRFNPGTPGIEVVEGGISAKGTRDHPISFVSNSPSPAPGDYLFAVKLSGKSAVSSFFEFCRFRHSVNAMIIDHGTPDLTYSVISDNSQAGIICGNDSSPKIEYNTLARNKGTGAVFCKATASPRMRHNNVIDNPFAIQSFSRIQIDARSN